jgi:hypothetical protein
MATTSPAITATVQVNSLRTTYAYGGSLRWPGLRASGPAEQVLLRVALPAWMPANAIIASAIVHIAQHGAYSGANTLNLRRNAAAFSSAATYTNKPALTDTNHPLTKTGSTDGTWWDFDVTADVQGFVAGTKANYGWNLSTATAAERLINGATSATLKPYLEIVYNIPGLAPSDLSPNGGAVSVAKPVLTFTVDDDTVSVQVQIDPASNGTTPAFDSGEVAATAGVLDLSATAYAGLAAAATTFWRARQKDALGWSTWSSWVSFSRTDLGVITLLAPTATPSDTTPPFEWSVAGGGTRTAWQARLLDATGKVLSDSGRVAGTGTTWTPPQGFTASGQQGTAEVKVYDNVVRAATPGAPAYALRTQALTVSFSSSVTPMGSVAASTTQPVPVVHLTGVRASGTPDEVVVLRGPDAAHLTQIARVPGTQVFTGTAFAYDDWSANMNVPAVYRVAPVVNGVVASGGPTVTITPVCSGLWIVDPSTNAAAVLWGDDAGDWQLDEIASVHQPVGAGQAPVRRRLNRPPFSGTVTGTVIDAMNQLAVNTKAVLDGFAANDAGRVYQLVVGRQNYSVLLGDIAVTPTPRSGGELVASARVNFWAVS